MKSRRLLWIVLVVQAALIVVELLAHYDTTVRQLALALTNVVVTLAVFLVDRWLRRKGTGLSWVTILLVAAAIWLDALGNFQHLYAHYWWWDRLTHTVGGMALSAGFIDFFQARCATGMVASWSVAAWLGMLIGQLIGSVYEISEWLGDFWFHTERVRGPYDTPHDLFQNLIGGLVVLMVFWILQKQHTHH